MHRLTCALGAALATACIAAAPASASSPDITISQVYGGGGNSGATYTNDFVELFNRSDAAVDLTGWTVQYASATGAFPASGGSLTLSGSVEPGHHFLVQEAPGSGGTTPLPTPDATGSAAMSGTDGKVRLLTPSGDVRDLVGYGSANQSETAAAPRLSNTTAALRADDGCTDTDDNSADFTAVSPEPRNRASAATPCGGGGTPSDDAPSVASVDPPNNANDVGLGANVTVTFSEPVDAAPSAFSLTCGGASQPVTVSGGPTTFTVDPDSDLPRGASCTFKVSASGVTDQDSDDPPDNMASDFTSFFNTIGQEVRIHDIQGASHISPLNGDLVSFVPGIVTAVTTNGFWFQDPNPDRSDKTSEGVFVFTSSRPTAAVGDAVEVSGRVQEFRSAAANLTTTEIARPTIATTGTGRTITPTIIGEGGRIPPNKVIENDADGNVETQRKFDPGQDGIDFHESLEGMLVKIRNAVATGPSVAFGEIPVVADRGDDATPRTSRGGVVVTPKDFNPERLILDDQIAPTPTDVDVRDRLGDVTAVVDYNFGNYKYEVTQTPTRTSGGLKRETTAKPSKDQLAVASFNVENLDPTDPPSKFQRLAAILVNNLRAPDLVAVEEIQDNDGPGMSPSTDATATWNELIDAITAAGGPQYQFRQINPEFGTDGGEPGGNIRQGFLFRTDRGLQFVDRPGGTATNSTAENTARSGAQLTFSPGRIDPTNEAFDDSRKPLAGEFTWQGKSLIVVANHFNSKGGDDPLFGWRQPTVRISEDQRHQQATVVNRFVQTLLAADKKANVVVLGDLNDFDFSETLDILKGHELSNLMDTLPLSERYSYDFDGNSQVLDQILVSQRLRQAAEYDSVHVNSEFHDQDSDHDPQIARLQPR